jgi:hypothetical protein
MSASSIVARSAGTWKRVRVQNAFSSVSLKFRAVSSSLSSAQTVRAASTLSFGAATATSSSGSTHNNSWLDPIRNTATRKFSSSAVPSNTSSADEPNADVEVDSGSVVPDVHLLVSKGDEQQEENKRRRLSDVRYLMLYYIKLHYV